MPVLKPIALENPCGKDMKYDDIYLAIEIEIEKSFNAIAETEVQWDKIIAQCESLLTLHTKDLKIVSYWLFSTWKMYGWTSLPQALEMYAHLIDTFQDKLYPLQPKRKVKILQWIENVLGDPLSQALGAFSNEQLRQLSETLEHLNNAATKITDGEHVFFKKVQQNIFDFFESEKRRISSIEEREKEQMKEELQRKEEEKRQQESKDARRTEEEEILSKFSSIPLSKTDEQPIQNVPLDHEAVEALYDPLYALADSLLKKAPLDYFSFRILFSIV